MNIDISVSIDNLIKADIFNVENGYYLLYFIVGIFIIYLIKQKDLLEKIIKLISPMFWIWYASKSNKIIEVAIFFMIAVIVFLYNTSQCWRLFIIYISQMADNFLIYVRNGFLSLAAGFLFGLFFWRYDLLKNSESSGKEDFNSHKSDKYTNNYKSDKHTILKDEANDYFGVWDKLNAIDNVLIKTDVLLSHKIIALYGDWGSGKSSIVETLIDRYDGDCESGKSGILNTLIRGRCKKAKKLETIFNDEPISEELITIKFDAWKYEKEDNLPYALLEFILSELENHKKANLEIKTKVRILKDKLLKSGKMVFKSIGTKFEFFGIEIGLERDDDKRKEIDNLFEGFDILSNILKKNNKRLIVFIDDLDRCEVKNVLNLLSSIKLLFASGDNINYFCAVDKEAVKESLKYKYNDGEKAEEYLEKIFNFSFNIPKFSVEKFVKQYGFNDDNAKKLAKFFEAINFTTPRHLKKVLNKYDYLVNIKTSDGIDRDLKKLIPDIICIGLECMPSTSKYYLKKYCLNQNHIGNMVKRLKSGSKNYLFDTIFVLYFIILYEFYYKKYLEIKNMDDKLNNYAMHLRNINWDITRGVDIRKYPKVFNRDKTLREYISDNPFDINFSDIVKNISQSLQCEKLNPNNKLDYDFDNILNYYLLKYVLLFTPLIMDDDEELGIFDNTRPKEFPDEKDKSIKREWHLLNVIEENKNKYYDNNGTADLYPHTIDNMKSFINQFEYKNNEILIDFCKYLISDEFFEIIENNGNDYTNKDYNFKTLFEMVKTLL